MFVVSLCLTVAYRRVALSLGITDGGGYRRIHENPTALLGGLAISSPFIFLCVLCGLSGYATVSFWKFFYTHFPNYFTGLFEIAQSRKELLALGAGASCIVVLGLIDDVRGLSARLKLGGQCAVALIVLNFIDYPTGINLPLIGAIHFGVLGGFFFSMLWIVGIINAFNLIDGMDGLATGIGAISALTFAVLGALVGNFTLVFLGMAMAGCLCGFLLFNFHPAKIFLGDTGSMFIGFTFAFITLSQSFRTEGATVLLAPMIALSFPIFETLISMVRRYSHGLPVFQGDNRHTHHRLLARGYSQRQTVLILYAIVGCISIAAIIDRLILDTPELWWIPGAIYTACFMFVLWFADYIAPWVLSGVLKSRRRNRKLGLLSRYGSLCLMMGSASECRKALFDLCRYELNLKYISAIFEDGETLIAASGKFEEKGSETDLEDVEIIYVTSQSRHAIEVRYQFEKPPQDGERMAVSSCLAGMFECSHLIPPEPDMIRVTEPEAEADKDQAMTAE